MVLLLIVQVAAIALKAHPHLSLALLAAFVTVPDKLEHLNAQVVHTVQVAIVRLPHQRTTIMCKVKQVQAYINVALGTYVLVDQQVLMTRPVLPIQWLQLVLPFVLHAH